jgi:hypothetical protein
MQLRLRCIAYDRCILIPQTYHLDIELFAKQLLPKWRSFRHWKKRIVRAEVIAVLCVCLAQEVNQVGILDACPDKKASVRGK